MLLALAIQVSLSQAAKAKDAIVDRPEVAAKKLTSHPLGDQLVF